MTILEAMQDKKHFRDLRVTYGDSWLVWNNGVFTVYHSGYRQRKSDVRYSGESEELAVEMLLADEEK
jgi:hypothetical protein